MDLPLDELLSFTPITHCFNESVETESFQDRMDEAIGRLINTPAYSSLHDAYNEATAGECVVLDNLNLFELTGIETPPSQILLSVSLFEEALDLIGITNRKFTELEIKPAKGRITPQSLYANTNEVAFIHKYGGEYFSEFTATSDIVHAVLLDATNMDPALEFEDSGTIYGEQLSHATIMPSNDGGLRIQDATRILKDQDAIKAIGRVALNAAEAPDNEAVADFIVDVSDGIRHFMRNVEVDYRYAFDNEIEFTYKLGKHIIADSSYSRENALIGPENIPENAQFSIKIPARTHQAAIGAVAIRTAEHQLLGRQFQNECAPWRELVDRITSALLDHFEDLPRLTG